MREGGRARPSSGTLGGQRGRAERYGKVQETQRTRTAQETVRKWHPVTARGNAHPLRRRVRLMLRVGMHRCSQQVPSMHTHTHTCVCVCVCVCIHHFIYHLPITYSAFERKCELVLLCGCACVSVFGFLSHLSVFDTLATTQYSCVCECVCDFKYICVCTYTHTHTHTHTHIHISLYIYVCTYVMNKERRWRVGRDICKLKKKILHIIFEVTQ